MSYSDIDDGNLKLGTTEQSIRFLINLAQKHMEFLIIMINIAILYGIWPAVVNGLPAMLRDPGLYPSYAEAMVVYYDRFKFVVPE